MPRIKSEKNKPTVYSALEVANLCGVVNQTAINWIKSGFLKAFKTPGGQFRVYPKDLLDFMNSRNMIIPEKLLADCDGKLKDRKKILLVDDDEAFNNVTKKFLEKNLENVEILQAFDGFEAGSVMVGKKPELLVLDLDLPGIDGVRLCHKIKEEKKFSSPKIIIVTALQDLSAEEECLSLGVEKYFKKPISLPELLAVIKDF